MAPTTILANIRDKDFFKEFPLGEQGTGGDPITPGMLVRITSDTVLPHSTQGVVPAPFYVAFESVRPDGGGVESVYDVEGESVPCIPLLSGDRFYGLLEVGANISSGTNLTSKGDGTLEALATGDLGAVVAREDVNNSGGSAPAYILVEVL